MKATARNRPKKASRIGLSTTLRKSARPTDTAAPDVGPLLARVVTILERARAQVVRTVNSAMVLAYWQIGRELVEYFQAGAARADYGNQLLEVLSARLQAKVGRGYSVTNLKYFRLFYQTYAERIPEIRHEARDELPGGAESRREARDVLAVLSLAAKPAGRLDGFSSRLSWTHYRTLTKVEHPAERAFYEIEADVQDWSPRWTCELRDVTAELSPGFQVIITEHADVNEDWYQAAVVERWRNDTGLIPRAWLTDGEPA